MISADLCHVLALEYVKNTVDFKNITPTEFLTKYEKVHSEMSDYFGKIESEILSDNLKSFLG